MKWFLIVVPLLFLSCRSIPPEKLSIDDPQIEPLRRAAASFDRVSHGFTPLPRGVTVHVDWSGEYNVTLDIASKTYHTIVFRKVLGGYRWIGEEETFQGPKQFTTPDGTFYEAITLLYEVERMSGYPTDRLNVIYRGEDPRLSNQPRLTLDQVRPVLKEWGY